MSQVKSTLISSHMKVHSIPKRLFILYLFIQEQLLMISIPKTIFNVISKNKKIKIFDASN
jgi:hypothetical protein